MPRQVSCKYAESLFRLGSVRNSWPCREGISFSFRWVFNSDCPRSASVVTSLRRKNHRRALRDATTAGTFAVAISKIDIRRAKIRVTRGCFSQRSLVTETKSHRRVCSSSSSATGAGARVIFNISGCSSPTASRAATGRSSGWASWPAPRPCSGRDFWF